MLIVNCIENSDSIFDYSFKDQALQDFSIKTGKIIMLMQTMKRQAYALQSNEKFYLSTMEEIQDDKLRFKVFELDTFGSLITTADNEFSWDKEGKTEELVTEFNIAN